MPELLLVVGLVTSLAEPVAVVVKLTRATPGWLLSTATYVALGWNVALSSSLSSSPSWSVVDRLTPGPLRANCVKLLHAVMSEMPVDSARRRMEALDVAVNRAVDKGFAKMGPLRTSWGVFAYDAGMPIMTAIEKADRAMYDHKAKRKAVAEGLP